MKVNYIVKEAKVSVEKDIKGTFLKSIRVGVRVPKTLNAVKGQLELAQPEILSEFVRLSHAFIAFENDYMNNKEVFHEGNLITSFTEYAVAKKEKQDTLENLEKQIRDSKAQFLRNNVLYFKNLTGITIISDNGEPVVVTDTRIESESLGSSESVLDALLTEFIEVDEDSENYLEASKLRDSLIKAVVAGVNSSFEAAKEGN